MQQARNTTRAPDIVPQGAIKPDQSSETIDAWWSPVSLGKVRGDHWFWRAGSHDTPSPDDAPRPSVQAGQTVDPSTENLGVCPIGEAQGTASAAVTTVSGLKDLVKNAPPNGRWKVKLSPSLAKRADQTLRKTVVVLSDPAHRDPAVVEDRRAMRTPLLGSNAILMPEMDGECVPVSPCVALDVSEAEARLHEADAHAFRSTAALFDFTARIDPSLARKRRPGMVAEDLMGLALAPLKQPNFIAKLSSEQQSELVKLLQTANDATKAFHDLLLATSLPRSQDMMRRIDEVQALHPEATVVVTTGGGHARDFEADPDWQKKDYAVIYRDD